MEILGYYTTDSCVLGTPQNKDSITKYVTRNEKGVEFITPPIDPSEIGVITFEDQKEQNQVRESLLVDQAAKEWYERWKEMEAPSVITMDDYFLKITSFSLPEGDFYLWLSRHGMEFSSPEESFKLSGQMLVEKMTLSPNTIIVLEKMIHFEAWESPSFQKQFVQTKNPKRQNALYYVSLCTDENPFFLQDLADYAYRRKIPLLHTDATYPQSLEDKLRRRFPYSIPFYISFRNALNAYKILRFAQFWQDSRGERPSFLLAFGAMHYQMKDNLIRGLSYNLEQIAEVSFYLGLTPEELGDEIQNSYYFIPNRAHNGIILDELVYEEITQAIRGLVEVPDYSTLVCNPPVYPMSCSE